MHKDRLIMAKKSNGFSELLRQKITVVTTGAALSLAFINGNPVQAATFRYTTATTEVLFRESKTILNGVTYDGVFVNSIFDPFAMVRRELSGFFSIKTGSLGEAIAVETVQKRPVDRTALGASGIARGEYLATAAAVATVPGAITLPPGLIEFDFKFVPAEVAGAPIVLSKGWSAEKVPEPGVVLTLGILSCGLLLRKKITSS